MIVDRRLLAISRGVELLAQLTPIARARLLSERALADGYSAGGPEVSVTSTSTTTTVESAAARRAAAQADLYQIDDDVEALWVMTTDVLRNVHRIAGRLLVEPLDPLDKVLCRPRGRDGCEEWAAGSLDCTERPVKRGLCDRHYMREYRWRQRNGLPTIDVEPAAGETAQSE